MKADLIVHQIKTLYTPNQVPPVKGKDLNNITMIDDAFLAIKDGKIIGVGTGDYHKFIDENTKYHDAENNIVIPGLIDGHTHLVHGGSRESEYVKLQMGTPYLDILKQGGGILGTVDKTRKATLNELYHKAYNSLDEMLLFGVTTVEAKSGYGLDLETEEKQLLVTKRLNEDHPVRLISTYMAAHAIPREFKDNRRAYIEQMLNDLPVIYEKGLAEAVDIFCETGVFSVEEASHILTKAKETGFKVKMHADEIDSLGGVGLAVELGAVSVDHLMAITDEDMEKLANSNTIANVLPGTSFYLKKDYARARAMNDKGVALGIAGDYNPGSCPTENFQLIMQLASNQLKLLPAEILNATTINPAYQLGLDQTTGSLDVGKDADFVIFNAENLTYVLYHYGVNHTKDVFIKGKQVVSNRQIVREL
ncbi:MAG: imidazolonepropionase [Acholeplasmataceae bacterium]